MEQCESCSSPAPAGALGPLKDLRRQLRLQAQTMKNQILTLATALSEASPTPAPPPRSAWDKPVAPLPAPPPAPQPLPPPPAVPPTAARPPQLLPSAAPARPGARPQRTVTVPSRFRQPKAGTPPSHSHSPGLRPLPPRPVPSLKAPPPPSPPSPPSPEPAARRRSPEASDRPVRQRKEKRPFALMSEVRLPDEMKRCQTVVAAIQRYKNAAPFMYPVDADLLGIPDYHQIVQRPMDLSTVSDKIAAGEYQSAQEVADDVALVWANCRLYNGEHHVYSQWAAELQEIFDKKMEPILQRFSEEEKERRRLEQHSKKYKKEIEELEARIREIKENPKRRLDLLTTDNDAERPMTEEEKQRLRQLIANVDSVTCAKVFDLIERSCPTAIAEGEEDVELDLDALDPRTFRAVDRLVQAALRRRLAEAKRRRAGRGYGAAAGEDDRDPPAGPPSAGRAGGRGRRGRPQSLQELPRRPSGPSPGMPLGFEELPSEAAFGRPGSPSDAESDAESGGSPRLGLGAHLHAAALRAGLAAESDSDAEAEDDAGLAAAGAAAAFASAAGRAVVCPFAS